MFSIGVKIDQFDIPVCNSFQAKVLNDQLCYEIDLDNYSNEDNIDRELKSGFNFIMDYNEDRQVIFGNRFQDNQNQSQSEADWASSIIESDQDQHQHAVIYLDTVGK